MIKSALFFVFVFVFGFCEISNWLLNSKLLLTCIAIAFLPFSVVVACY